MPEASRGVTRTSQEENGGKGNHSSKRQNRSPYVLFLRAHSCPPPWQARRTPNPVFKLSTVVAFGVVQSLRENPVGATRASHDAPPEPQKSCDRFAGRMCKNEVMRPNYTQRFQKKPPATRGHCRWCKVGQSDATLRQVADLSSGVRLSSVSSHTSRKDYKSSGT